MPLIHTPNNNKYLLILLTKIVIIVARFCTHLLFLYAEDNSSQREVNSATNRLRSCTFVFQLNTLC